MRSYVQYSAKYESCLKIMRPGIDRGCNDVFMPEMFLDDPDAVLMVN